MTRTLLLLGILSLTIPALANPLRAAEQQDLVDKARITVESFARDPDMAPMRSLLKRAHGVLIVPQWLKAGFIIGGAGGSGVLLARNGDWSGPAFVDMAAGSVGLQIGAQAAEVILLLMTEHAVDAMLHNKVKIGADLSAAAGPVGKGIEAATTTNLRDDVYAYSRAKGLLVGLSLEGAAIKTKAKWNSAYYGESVTARQIVLERAVTGENADSLKEALTAAAR